MTTTELAQDLRYNAMLPEHVLWEHLRARRLAGFKFRRQHPIEPYMLDFYCPELKLAVEVDGDVHHTEDQAAHDERRDRWLAQRGVRTVRIPARLVLGDIHAVVRQLLFEVGAGV
jgi:ATP-dependent DNA helicase RecQ